MRNFNGVYSMEIALSCSNQITLQQSDFSGCSSCTQRFLKAASTMRVKKLRIDQIPERIYETYTEFLKLNKLNEISCVGDCLTILRHCGELSTLQTLRVVVTGKAVSEALQNVIIEGSKQNQFPNLCTLDCGLGYFEVADYPPMINNSFVWTSITQTFLEQLTWLRMYDSPCNNLESFPFEQLINVTKLKIHLAGTLHTVERVLLHLKKIARLKTLLVLRVHASEFPTNLDMINVFKNFQSRGLRKLTLSQPGQTETVGFDSSLSRRMKTYFPEMYSYRCTSTLCL